MFTLLNFSSFYLIFFPFLFLLDVISSVQIVHLIKLSSAQPHVRFRLSHVSSGLQLFVEGSPTIQVINSPWVISAILAEQMTQHLACHLKDPLSYDWEDFSHDLFIFPPLAAGLRDHLCPRVGNTNVGSRDGCKAANKREGLSVPGPTCPSLNKRFSNFLQEEFQCSQRN